jgi:hypothetical protein
MKTSEEMARSVMGRAKAKRAAQKRNIIAAAIALVCAGGIGAGVWMMGKTPAQPAATLQSQTSVTPQTQPTEPSQTQPMQPSAPNQVTNIELRPVRISLLSSLSSGGDTVTLENGVRIPGQQQIRVLDIRGMTEEEIQAAYEAEKKYAASVVEQYRKPLEDNSRRFEIGKNGMVTLISAGCLHVPIEDSSLVEDIRVYVTGDGRMCHIQPLREYGIGGLGEDEPKEYIIRNWEVGKDNRMIWMLSEEMIYELENDPTIPLSSITSTITATANMKDGTKVSVVVDVTVDDDGMVYFTSRGETAE